MSEFDILAIETKINENTVRIDKLKKAQVKIKTNQQQVEVKSVERVNKVALFSVTIPHTSEYLIKLGKDYIAKVKAKNALEIISSRIKHLEEQNSKWIPLKQKMGQKGNKNQVNQIEQRPQNMVNNYRPQAKVEVIGENEDGEEIVNICQFQEDFDYKDSKPEIDQQPIQEVNEENQDQQNIEKTIKQDKEQRQQISSENKIKKQNSDQMKKQTQKQTIVPQIKQKPTQQTAKTQQIPKKISKFKAQRMQMKQK